MATDSSRDHTTRNETSSLLVFERLAHERPDYSDDYTDDRQSMLPFAELPFATRDLETLPAACLPLHDAALRDKPQPAMLFDITGSDDAYSGSLFRRVISTRPMPHYGPPPSALTAAAVALGVAIVILGLSSITSAQVAPQPQENSRVANNLPPARIVGPHYVVTPEQN